MTAVRVRIAGVAAAPGVARGPWAELTAPPLPPPRALSPVEVPQEILKLRAAAAATARELIDLSASVREAGHDAEAQIFRAHSLIARDPDLLTEASRQIEADRVDAATAVVAAGRASAERVAALEDELLRARATDIMEVAERIGRRAAGLPTRPGLDRPAIVVAADLGPSMTATLPRELVLGIVLEGSSPTAHAAILARAYGIPAVVGATGVLDAVHAAGGGIEVGIDGGSGEVLVAPAAEDIVRLDRLASAADRARAADLAEAALPALTRDGLEIELLANIGGPDEAAPAVALGAEGVGLFRTEFLFMGRVAPPTEDEQTAAYRAAVEAFGGHAVTIRLLDVGGDKPIPYLPIPREDNPFLGVRAFRLAGERPELFVTQLRACYRAATAGPVRVMAPMIADAADAQAFLDLAEESRAQLEREGIPHGSVELGVMLEIPAAILTAETWFDRVAFASLGTNDLLQYTMAVDRGNPALEQYRDSLHPAQLRLIRMAAEAAAAAKVSLSVCGEMAGDPAAALALIGLGVRALSMAASSLPAVRRAIRGSQASRLRAAADQALGARSAGEARRLLDSVLAESTADRSEA